MGGMPDIQRHSCMTDSFTKRERDAQTTDCEAFFFVEADWPVTVTVNATGTSVEVGFNFCACALLRSNISFSFALKSKPVD